MADSELDEEEVSQEEVDPPDEESYDDESSDDGGGPTPEQKKKKQLIMVGAIVGVVIVLLVVVGMFFSGPEKTQAQIEDEKAEKRKGVVVLTGYGEFLYEKIPDLANIPYADEVEQLEQTKDVTGAGEKKITIAKKSTLPSGEVVYTAGSNNIVGKKHTEDGVVLIANMQVQKGDNNEQVIQSRIHNQSSKYLANVNLDILFLNSQGKTMFKRAINPLVVSGGLFGDKIQTLAPGASRIFIVDATEVPQGWSQEVNYAVVDYSFVQ
ncbi:MAG: hypothetical protein HQL68_09790 [Magnetococcales bacterium]|nr:hypothetical protein [Magnetococcales bacterium]